MKGWCDLEFTSETKIADFLEKSQITSFHKGQITSFHKGQNHKLRIIPFKNGMLPTKEVLFEKNCPTLQQFFVILRAVDRIRRKVDIFNFLVESIIERSNSPIGEFSDFNDFADFINIFWKKRELFGENDVLGFSWTY